MSEQTSFAFLGEEFLTWLWFRLETEGGDFDLGDGHVVGISLDDFLAFAPRDDDETEHTMRKGVPSRSSSARAALRAGRRLRRAKLVLAQGELQWNFVLDAACMGLRSVRLPDDDEEAEGPADRSRDRIANFLLLHELVSRLYREFLRLRLRREYLTNEGEQQAAWMAGA
ncbi:MAG: hypothetical protein IT457_07330 [Planctomycetes bacterium]|nr:hypothetical protein [Planctomycetota bacterium]